MKLGSMVSINQVLDQETAIIVSRKWVTSANLPHSTHRKPS